MYTVKGNRLDRYSIKRLMIILHFLLIWFFRQIRQWSLSSLVINLWLLNRDARLPFSNILAIFILIIWPVDNEFIGSINTIFHEKSPLHSTSLPPNTPIINPFLNLLSAEVHQICHKTLIFIAFSPHQTYHTPPLPWTNPIMHSSYRQPAFC